MTSEPEPEPEYPHWNRVYIGVVVFTTVVIVCLWWFAEIFTP